MSKDPVYNSEEADMNAVELLLSRIRKDIFIFVMARAQRDRPGARERAVKAARNILKELKDWS